MQSGVWTLEDEPLSAEEWDGDINSDRTYFLTHLEQRLADDLKDPTFNYVDYAHGQWRITAGESQAFIDIDDPNHDFMAWVVPWDHQELERISWRTNSDLIRSTHHLAYFDATVRWYLPTDFGVEHSDREQFTPLYQRWMSYEPVRDFLLTLPQEFINDFFLVHQKVEEAWISFSGFYELWHGDSPSLGWFDAVNYHLFEELGLNRATAGEPVSIEFRGRYPSDYDPENNIINQYFVFDHCRSYFQADFDLRVEDAAGYDVLYFHVKDFDAWTYLELIDGKWFGHVQPKGPWSLDPVDSFSSPNPLSTERLEYVFNDMLVKLNEQLREGISLRSLGGQCTNDAHLFFSDSILQFDFYWNEENIEIGANDISMCMPATITKEDIGELSCSWYGTLGNGIVEMHEECDDGNLNAFPGTDGCFNGKLDNYFTCKNTKLGDMSVCWPNCGDGVLMPGEQCDDGNNEDGDGCSAECTQESEYNCVQLSQFWPS